MAMQIIRNLTLCSLCMLGLIILVSCGSGDGTSSTTTYTPGPPIGKLTGAVIFSESNITLSVESTQTVEVIWDSYESGTESYAVDVSFLFDRQIVFSVSPESCVLTPRGCSIQITGLSVGSAELSATDGQPYVPRRVEVNVIEQ